MSPLQMLAMLDPTALIQRGKTTWVHELTQDTAYQFKEWLSRRGYDVEVRFNNTRCYSISYR